jgi:DNA-binding NarL/FixJ family response regulator
MNRETAAIRVLIADDHRMVRAGVRALLSVSSLPVRCVVEESETTEQTMDKIGMADFDVILMDYQFPDLGGAKATEIILQHRPQACVLCLSSYDERSYAEKMIRAGARGYILKNVEPDTLLSAIRTVMNGKRFYSNEIALKWMDSGMSARTLGMLDRLTMREREVFRQILAGLRDREIAERLFLSKRTIDKHRQNLMAKLGAHNAIELVQAAVTMGMMG